MLASLFPSSLTKLIFILAPVQLIVVNPIAFVLIEIGLVGHAVKQHNFETAQRVLDQHRTASTASNLASTLLPSSDTPSNHGSDADTEDNNSNNGENNNNRDNAGRGVQLDDNYDLADLEVMELHPPPPPTLKITRVLLNVLKNPIVYMTLLGLIFNFMVNHNPPKIINNFLTTLGNVFGAGTAQDPLL